MGSSLPLYLIAFEAFRLGILHQSERQRRFRRNAAYIFLRLYFLRFCLLVVFSIFDWRVYPKQPTFQREVGSEAHSVVTRSFLISFRWLYSHLRRGPLPARRKISVNIRYVSNILLSC